MKKILILILLLAILCIFFPSKAKGDAEVQQVTVTAKPVELIPVPAYVKAEYLDNYLLVYEAFKDTPRVFPVVNCESGFAQFDKKTGKPLRSPTSDVGIMQINQVHWAEAKALGLDIFNSPADNVAMGKIILKKQGINAWVCHSIVK